MMNLNPYRLYEPTESGYRQLMPFIVNKKDRSILIQVPAGEFEMGDGEWDNNPKHTVYLDTYYIGVYTVTNRQYKQFVDETGHRGQINSKWTKNEFIDHPVDLVLWDDAMAYCKWAGLNLPTEAQWEKAARGPMGYLYSWGNEWDSNRCLNDWNKGSEDTGPVYRYSTGASGYGSYNQSGNICEWCSDWWDSDYYKSSPQKNPPGPSSPAYGYANHELRVTRGGWYSGVGKDRAARRSRATRRGCDDTQAPSHGLGFRCALAPG